MPDYVIRISVRAADKPTVTERLVRAKNVAQAIAHVVMDTVQVDKASTDDLVRLTKLGIEIETAI